MQILQMLEKMKIWTRLALGFGLILALLVVVGASSIRQLSTMNDSTSDIVNNKYPKVEKASFMVKEINDAQRYLSAALLTGDISVIQKEVEHVKQTNEKVAKVAAELSKAVTTEEEKSGLKNATGAATQYLGAQQKVIDLLLNMEQEKAQEVSRVELVPALEAYLGAIDKFVKIETDAMSVSVKLADDTYRGASSLTIILVLAAMGLGVVAGLIMTKSLTNQLGGEPSYAADVARRISEGDLSMEIELKRGDQSSMLYAIGVMRDGLADIVSRVRGAADSISISSNQIATGNSDLSNRSADQASSLEETSASMEEMSGSVAQNAENARRANELARTATDVAQKGGQVVSQVVSTMKEIDDGSRKIADIIGVIEGIAFRTNILALNAAVEAARAGEQGRGFAVVASEVRNLAGRCAEASKEIKDLISASVDRVDLGSKLVQDAGVTMGEIVSSVQTVANIIGEISNAAAEQSAGIEQVNAAITSLDHATQQNAALVEESSAAAETMLQQSSQLVQAVSVFRLR